ncbi:hypothetical protein [Bradyrhizobium sp. F1.13.3]|uniref:hypothetical protein n=1 Tax=Bradyrhizobium sp. F1.13.3 TaxID=3156351 RepID=UPI003390E9D8
MFQVLTPADDLNLLTIKELRAAAGLLSTDGTKDSRLRALGARVSAMIAGACNLARDGVNPPTLMLEGCRDTFRVESPRSGLFLSRKFVSSVASVTVAGSSLTRDVDYELDAAGGKLTRLCGDNVSCWASGKIVVEYDAGFEEVPEDLKAIAAQLAGGYWADDGVDPMEKSLTIPGIIAVERWVDASADPQMPKDILNALISGGYVNRAMVL